VYQKRAETDNADMTMQEQNKTLVEEFIQALFTKGDVSAVERYLADDFVAHDSPMPDLPGDATGFREAATRIRAAFPDWRSDVHLLMAEGDYVAEHFTASGTQRGDFMGVSATNRMVQVPGINIFRLRDGKISERWGLLDMAAFFAQLGVSPFAPPS
jgi:steroid delta-isomerase-like uncharacterized protein